jgi:hypothetical protein
MKTVRSLLSLADGSILNRHIIRSELTFIILARTTDGELANGDILTLPMIGDVNIFLNGTAGDVGFESEVEIMIAGKLALRRIPAPPLSVHLPPARAPYQS